MSIERENDGNLRPCPFCGGSPEIEQTGKMELTLRCKSCVIGIKQKTLRYGLDWLRAAITEGWNKRTPPEPESSKELIEATAIKFARWATDNNWHLQLGADLWINFTSMEQANSKGVYAIFASALNKHKGENNQGKH